VRYTYPENGYVGTHIVRSKLFHIIQITGRCIVFSVSENRPLWPCGVEFYCETKGWNENVIHYDLYKYQYYINNTM